MDAEMRRLVRRRASGRCEYCQLPQAAQPFTTFHTEHVIPKKHGGRDEADNLCLACARCNACKGPNLTGIDPLTGGIERIFHPRLQGWHDHFSLQGSLIVGLSAVGRTTVEVLGMNEERRIQLRADLIDRGEF